MEETNKILLNSQRLPNNVNVTTQVQLGLENTNKPLPLNDIDTTVDQYEQFLKERKGSSTYRFYGVVKPVISNPLFNENVKIYEDNENNIQAKTILSSGIFEKDGWVGYYNDEPDEDALQFNDNKSALCDFSPFDPGYDRLRMLDSDGKQNYLLKITYPFESVDNVEIVKGLQLKNGVPIIEKFSIELNGRLYTGFRTAMNHGLSEGDRIQLINFIDLTSPNTLNLTTKNYKVFKLGNVTNNKKLRTFVIDVNPADINFTIGGSTIKRVVKDKPSQYYVRRYKSLTVDYKDYDLYPAAYGVSYFNDDVAAFNFKKDIDVKGLVDNLGRPLSQLYLSIIKNDRDSDPTSINTQYWNSVLNETSLSSTITTNSDGSTRFWTTISAGYDLENDVNVNYNIRSYGDTNYLPSTYYETIDESDETFDGDIVEYNENELFERSLEAIYHRVNTIYREYLNAIKPEYENKKEGYIYNPFNTIQIREFANYINPVVNLQSIIDKFNITTLSEVTELRKSFQIPDYATEISPNVYKWRDLLDIGFIDSSGGGVDYPFESGAHYIYLDKTFYFQRQDPPCQFVLISEDITLGASDIGNVEQNKFLNLLSDPTYLSYKLLIPTISLFNNTDTSSFSTTPENGLLIYNTNNDISNGDGVGYYQWNGQWNKTIFTLDSGGNTLDVLNYNGIANLNIEITLADYVGEYELGKRDVAGGCVDLSLLKENTLDDVC